MPRECLRFEFAGVMREEAAELQSALAQARIVHKGDLDAGGHHFEDAMRRVLQRRFPGRFDLGKGHVLDHDWSSSPEFDVVVADVSAGSIFFTASDGTRYYPYEAVYGVGEVKSSFRRGDRPLEHLIESIATVKTALQRESTPSNYVPGIGPVPQVSGGWPYRNPLFTFAVFGEGRDVTLDDVRRAYEGVPWSRVPNVLCFLDLGIVTLCNMVVNDEGRRVLGRSVPVPEFAENSDQTDLVWALLPMGDISSRQGANLAALEWLLMNHLARVVLMPTAAEMLYPYLTNAGLMRLEEPLGVRATRPPGDERPATLRG